MINDPLNGAISTCTTSVMSRRLRVRRASLGDYDAIASVLSRNGLAVRRREDWEALWNTNPACVSQQAEWPIGWLLETPEEEIVGSITNIPLAYRFRGRNLRVAVFADWAVDVRLRGYSTWLLSKALTQQNVDLYLATTLSPTTESLFRSLKWLPVPVGNWNRSAFSIADYHGFVSAFFRARSVPLPTFVTYPVAAALFCADRLRDSGLSRNGRPFEIELCSTFDERFDEFWQELETRNPQALLAVRSRESLAWHFRSRLIQGSVWILAANNGSRMIGYAIFDRADNTLLGLKRVRLVDYLALENSEQVLQAFWRWMLHVCRRDGIHLLEVVGWHDRAEFRRIRSLYQRSLGAWLYYYRASNSELQQALQDPKAWFPSSFDGDASL